MFPYSHFDVLMFASYVVHCRSCLRENPNGVREDRAGVEALGGIVKASLVRGSLGIVLIVAMVSLITVVGISDALSAQTGGSFQDDNGNVHEANIEFIAALGITRGCNPPANTNFCPSGTVTRGQMAAFLTRALALPQTSVDFFNDDSGSTFQNDINRLAAAGITAGCNPPANTNYCPDNKVTRGQMAAFLKRGFKLGATATDFFTDDNGSTFEDDINRLATSGITLGCNPPSNTNFCPDQTVRRDQMASFLARALRTDTPPPTTTPPTTTPTNAVITQTKFQFFNGGSEAGATAAADVNIPAVMSLNTAYSLRIGLSNTGTAPLAVAPKLQYRYIGAQLPGPVWSAWTDVTASSSRVRAAASPSMSDGQATTERLGGPRTFVPGQVDVNGVIGSGITLDPDRETEFVFSIQITSPTIQNEQFEFRLVVATGALFNAYGDSPAANIPFSFANGFDTGSDGTIITPAGSANPQPWSGVIPLIDPGAPRYDATVKFRGTMSGKFDRQSTDPASYVRVNDFNQAHDLYGRLYFRYAGVPAPEGTRIVDVVGGFENGDSNSHSITLTAVGRINMKAGGVAGTSGETDLQLAPVLAVNTWYRIEWHAATETTIGAGNGNFEVRIYSATGTLLDTGIIASPLAFTKTEFEDADFGTRSQTVTGWIDEVKMSNTGWVGP